MPLMTGVVPVARRPHADVGLITTGSNSEISTFYHYRNWIEGAKSFEKTKALNAAHKYFAWIKKPYVLVGSKDLKISLLSGYRSMFRSGTLALFKDAKTQLAAGGISAGIASGISFWGVELGVIVASGSAYVMGAAAASTAGAAAIGGGVGNIVNHVIYNSTTLSDTQRDLIRFEKQANSTIAKLGFKVLRGIFW